MSGHHAGRSGHHDRAGRGDRMFQQLDTDRDGSLSTTEQQAFRQAMHAQMPSQEGPQRRLGGAPAQPSAPAQPGS